MSEAIENSATRKAGFLVLLDAMLAGGSAEAARVAKPLIDSARPEDLVAVVDAAVDRGDDFALLKPAVSRLVNLLASSLKRVECRPPAGERFFSSLLAENDGLSEALDRGKALSRAINETETAEHGAEKRLAAARGLLSLLDELAAIEIHYRKKENVLFPWFEAHYPEYRCVRLMWDIHDDARRGLKDVRRELDAVLSAGDESFNPERLNQAIGRLYFDLNANIFRERYALFPVLYDLVQPADSEHLFEQADEYGYAFLSPDSLARFEGSGVAQATREENPATPPAGFSGRTGALPNKVLASMFSALPVDMTWVDADDKVRWFSDSPHRIFPRSPAIIGRDVRNCHPGSSVGRVVAIIESFRSGAKDREAFWIQMQGRFIHIEYFALRSPEGEYLGVLEASQDLTDLRALSGEKRLAN
ncbi:MAG: DUF438 domain-containing protein [Spirochaetales bacterium]|nr:DUF438 domain-containing protein [Spirochaetales bacterium]